MLEEVRILDSIDTRSHVTLGTGAPAAGQLLKSLLIVAPPSAADKRGRLPAVSYSASE